MSCRDYEDALLDLARGVLASRDEALLRAHLAQCGPCAARLVREKALTSDLRTLAGATADLRPSASMEARLLAEYQRFRPEQALAAPAAAMSISSGARGPGWTAWRPWLAAAAAVSIVVGGAAAWRAHSVSVRPGALGVQRQTLATAREAPPALPAPAADGERFQGFEAAPTADGAPGRRPAPRRLARGAARAEFVAWPGARALPAFESGQLVRTELPVSVVPLLGLRVEALPEGGTVAADVIVGQDGMPRAVRLAR
jgi:hypothetical protein